MRQNGLRNSFRLSSNEDTRTMRAILLSSLLSHRSTFLFPVSSFLFPPSSTVVHREHEAYQWGVPIVRVVDNLWPIDYWTKLHLNKFSSRHEKCAKMADEIRFDYGTTVKR